MVTNCLKKVCLSQANSTVNYQGIELRLPWRFCHCQCRSMGKAVALTNNEIFKRITFIECCGRRSDICFLVASFNPILG